MLETRECSRIVPGYSQDGIPVGLGELPQLAPSLHLLLHHPHAHSLIVCTCGQGVVWPVQEPHTGLPSTLCEYCSSCNPCRDTGSVDNCRGAVPGPAGRLPQTKGSTGQHCSITVVQAQDSAVILASCSAEPPSGSRPDKANYALYGQCCTLFARARAVDLPDIVQARSCHLPFQGIVPECFSARNLWVYTQVFACQDSIKVNIP